MQHALTDWAHGARAAARSAARPRSPVDDWAFVSTSGDVGLQVVRFGHRR